MARAAVRVEVAKVAVAMVAATMEEKVVVMAVAMVVEMKAAMQAEREAATAVAMVVERVVARATMRDEERVAAVTVMESAQWARTQAATAFLGRPSGFLGRFWIRGHDASKRLQIWTWRFDRPQTGSLKSPRAIET